MNPDGYVHQTELPEVIRYLEGLQHRFMVIYWLGPRQKQRAVTNPQGVTAHYTHLGGRALSPRSVLQELKQDPSLSEPGYAGPMVGLAKYRGQLDEAGLAQAFQDLMRTFAGPDWDLAPDPKRWFKLFGWLYREDRPLFDAKLLEHSRMLSAQAAPAPAVLPEYDPEDA